MVFYIDDILLMADSAEKLEADIQTTTESEEVGEGAMKDHRVSQLSGGFGRNDSVSSSRQSPQSGEGVPSPEE